MQQYVTYHGIMFLVLHSKARSHAQAMPLLVVDMLKAAQYYLEHKC